jgi:hypothetical protein
VIGTGNLVELNCVFLRLAGCWWSPGGEGSCGPSPTLEADGGRRDTASGPSQVRGGKQTGKRFAAVGGGYLNCTEAVVTGLTGTGNPDLWPPPL